jgi:Uma2 family endonuclease
MSKTAVRIGPEDNGQKMSLTEFDTASVAPGFKYELSRGFIVVSEVPNPGAHLRAITAILQQLFVYRLKYPEQMNLLATGDNCKILLEQLESERHPDVAVYKRPPPSENSSAWSAWIPELVIEVVSPDSAERDHKEKPEEYLQFGVKEYWIVEPQKRQMSALRRWRGKWDEQVIRPPKKYKTPVFPGLSLDCAALFEAK